MTNQITTFKTVLCWGADSLHCAVSVFKLCHVLDNDDVGAEVQPEVVLKKPTSLAELTISLRKVPLVGTEM